MRHLAPAWGDRGPDGAVRAQKCARTAPSHRSASGPLPAVVAWAQYIQRGERRRNHGWWSSGRKSCPVDRHRGRDGPGDRPAVRSRRAPRWSVATSIPTGPRRRSAWSRPTADRSSQARLWTWATGTDIDRWVGDAVERHGRIDVLYNNASMPKFAPFAQMSGEDYRFTIQNELDLVWHACQAAWPHLAARRRCDRQYRLGGRNPRCPGPAAGRACRRQGRRHRPHPTAGRRGCRGRRPRQLRESRGHGDPAGARDVRGVRRRTHRSPRSSSARSTASPGTRSRSRMQAFTSPPTRRNGSRDQPRRGRRSQRDHVVRKTGRDAWTAVPAEASTAVGCT